MEILELVKPSPWIESEDREWAFKIQSIINQLEQCFNEALVSLILFDKETVKQMDLAADPKVFFEDSARRSAIRRAIEPDFDLTVFENHEHLSNKVESILKQEKINEGSFPRSMQTTLPFIYAKSFLYSLDTIEKLINILSKQTSVPDDMSRIKKLMGQNFPDLIHVRDSSHHIEDRVIGQRRNSKIELQPIDDDGIKSDGGLLVLSNLAGSSFGCTLGDGRFGKVDVSRESLDIVRGIIQSVINSFQWKSLSRHRSQS